MEKKNNLAVIISCLSFAVALFCAVFIWCKSREVGHVVDLGTFIGVCVGLIGIFAAAILGLQIWNHVEFNAAKQKIDVLENKIKEVEKIKKRMEQERFCQLVNHNKIRTSISNLYVALMRREDISVELKAFYAILELCLHSITREDLLKQDPESLKNSSHILLNHLECLQKDLNEIEYSELISEHITDFKDMPIHREYVDYTNIIHLHSSIVLKFNELKAKHDNAKTKDAQPK